MQSRLIRLILVVFRRVQCCQCPMNIIHIQGVWQNAHKFIRQLAHCYAMPYVVGRAIEHLALAK